jgi:hypothetical protein
MDVYLNALKAEDIAEIIISNESDNKLEIDMKQCLQSSVDQDIDLFVLCAVKIAVEVILIRSIVVLVTNNFKNLEVVVIIITKMLKEEVTAGCTDELRSFP